MKEQKKSKKPYKIIGERVKIARIAAGFKTQEDITEHYGLADPDYWSTFERGDRKIPLKHARRLAELSGKRLEWILGEDNFETQEDKDQWIVLSSISLLERIDLECMNDSFRALNAYLGEQGYQLTMNISNSVTPETAFFLNNTRKDETICTVSLADLVNTRDNISDYVKMQVMKLEKRFPNMEGKS